MSYHFQSDEPSKISIEVSIQISFPVTPLTNNDQYFSEKREASSLIANVLKEMGITDYKLRYCLVIDGELGAYTYGKDDHARFYLVPGPQQWNELGHFIVQITAQISKDIVENKDTIYISAAFMTIIAPLTAAVFKILHREKKRQESIGNPSMTLGIDNHFVKVEGPDQKKNEEDAKRIMEDLLKERPSMSMNRKINMRAKLAGSSQYRPKRKRRRRG